MEQSTPPFAENLKSIQVDDISSSLAITIDELCKEWKALDENYLEHSNSNSKSFIAIPYDFPIYPLELERLSASAEHPRFPKDATMRDQYIEKLKNIFSRVPKADVWLNKLNESSLEVVKYNKNHNHVSADTYAVPEMVSLTGNESISGDYSCTSDQIKKVDLSSNIYTFATYNIRTNALEQKIQILGHQKLSQLKDRIYCVQDFIGYPNETKQSFFYLNSAFYIDDRCANIDCKDVILSATEWLQTVASSKPYQGLVSSAGATNDLMQDNVESGTKNKENKKARLSLTLDSSSNISVYTTHLHAVANESEQSVETEPSKIGADEQERMRRKSSKSTLSKSFTDVHGLSPLESAVISDMTSTSIDSCCAALPVGKPYLFTHQHHCEHVLVLLERQKFHPGLYCSDEERYPREIYRAKHKTRRCQVCDALSAVVMTFYDRLAETSPSYFCRQCFDLLHLGADGNLLYDDFIEWPYYHDT